MQRNLAAEMGSGEGPLLVRLGGKLVLEILPAALASAIGAFLFAQYQFSGSAAGEHSVTPAVTVPASAEMLQLVREEHAMIRDFLTAQRTAEQKRAVALNGPDATANARGDIEPAAAAPVEADSTNIGKAAARRKKAIVAAATPESAATALPPITVAAARQPAATQVLVASAASDATAPGDRQANAQGSAGQWPSAPPPARPSLVTETLAVPGHVVSVTLHAVMAIGGIPSWLGHRFGDDDAGAGALPYSSAS